jgi:DnaK suppressor protein
MDEIDLAQHYDEYYRQAALRDHFRNRNKPVAAKSIRPVTRGISGEGGGARGICTDCGNEIEPARLEALPGAVRCVYCQGRHERRLSHG